MSLLSKLGNWIQYILCVCLITILDSQPFKDFITRIENTLIDHINRRIDQVESELAEAKDKLHTTLTDLYGEDHPQVAKEKEIK